MQTWGTQRNQECPAGQHRSFCRSLSAVGGQAEQQQEEHQQRSGRGTGRGSTSVVVEGRSGDRWTRNTGGDSSVYAWGPSPGRPFK